MKRTIPAIGSVALLLLSLAYVRVVPEPAPVVADEPTPVTTDSRIDQVLERLDQLERLVSEYRSAVEGALTESAAPCDCPDGCECEGECTCETEAAAEPEPQQAAAVQPTYYYSNCAGGQCSTGYQQGYQTYYYQQPVRRRFRIFRRW